MCFTLLSELPSQKIACHILSDGIVLDQQVLPWFPRTRTRVLACPCAPLNGHAALREHVFVLDLGSHFRLQHEDTICRFCYEIELLAFTPCGRRLAMRQRNGSRARRSRRWPKPQNSFWQEPDGSRRSCAPSGPHGWWCTSSGHRGDCMQGGAVSKGETSWSSSCS